MTPHLRKICRQKQKNFKKYIGYFIRKNEKDILSLLRLSYIKQIEGSFTAAAFLGQCGLGIGMVKKERENGCEKKICLFIKICLLIYDILL
ncbi:MAG: hypothetical protein E7330_08025 [Clostridiales bacterium]|nr:hypothetical protein [Clostridiales bacterium]